jgi:DNA helicase II / ATP-dependent DNA helicase PcrA
MAWNDGLTGRPLEIARSNSRNIRIVAGPGTGKTFSLKKRITRLLEEGIDPGHILVVTFTRVAARDLLKELHTIGIDGCNHLNIGTIHSFCFKMLLSREILPQLGRVPRPLIYFNRSGVMQFEGKALLHDIEQDKFGDKRECTKRIRAFEAAWSRLQSDDPGWPTNPIDREFQTRLLDWLTFHESILIGELIPLSLNFLRTNPLAVERNSFEHVIIDEYQDLNRAEQVLIDFLAESGSIFVVGDVNQSIYSFRYANPEGILEYPRRHPTPTDLPLIECRRCPKGVVKLANCLIRHNYTNPDEIILNEYEDNAEGNINIIQWADNDSEAIGLADFINVMIENSEFRPEDVLILCPRRELGIKIRYQLTNRGIPAHSFYHEEILLEIDTQVSFSILSLLINRYDRVALRFFLGCDSPSFLKRQYRILMDYCMGNSISPYDALNAILRNELKIKGIGDLSKRFSLLNEILEKFENKSGLEIFNILFPSGDPKFNLIRNIISSEIHTEDSLDVSEVFTVLTTYVTQPEVPSEIDYVRIMSLHKSKGLTSRVVIITSCIEGLIPTIENDLDYANRNLSLQEQRRLFYVGLTRSKEVLVLSSFSNIERNLAFKIGVQIRGWGTNTIASRFLNELGPTAPNVLNANDWEYHST